MLVVAGGSPYSYFGHDDWAAHAPELKSLDGALDLRDRILLAFEAAEVETDDAAREAWLTFVVVGAGPTGVEMAGQIAELARDVLPRDYRDVDTRTARVLLVEAGDRVLAAYGDSSPRARERQLRSLGVTPLLESMVTEIDADGVDARVRASASPARTKVWAAGVAASPLARLLADAAGAEIDRAGRIVVEPDLTRGRASGGVRVRRHGRRARTASCTASLRSRCSRGGTSRARSATDERKPFPYNDKGELATIGRARAVGLVKGVRVTGFLAWAMWLGIHIVYLVGFQNRLLVLTRWAFAYVTRGRGARVIHRPRARRAPRRRSGPPRRTRRSRGSSPTSSARRRAPRARRAAAFPARRSR